MNPITVRMTADDWNRLRRDLFTDDGYENAAVLFCGAAQTDTGRRLLVRAIWRVPEDCYLERKRDFLKIAPAFYNAAVDRCLAEKMQPIIVHSHPHSNEAQYSQADDHGESQILPVLASLIPGATPASLILARKSIIGRRFVSGGFVSLDSVTVVGLQVVTMDCGSSPSGGGYLSERFDRQVRVFGPSGQRVLEALKVAVVGVGGTGSLVAEQLARAGVQDVVLIDSDRVEVSNLSRLFGATANDIGNSKAITLADHLRRLGANRVIGVADSAIRQDVLMLLRDRDVVFSCVDNDRSRALLNRFSHQYLVPVVDVGIRLDAREGEMIAAAGRVSVVGSGLVCLRCSHHVSTERIRAESLPVLERQSLQREGYIIGVDDPAPAIVTLNAVIAGLGTTAALNLFVKMTGGEQPMDQLYDATTGSVFPVKACHQVGCDICDNEVGIKAVGDMQIVSAYD